MKYTIILFCLLAAWPFEAFAQSYVNPDTIYQSGDIILHNTDVYYCPFAPPADTDTRAGLCADADVLLDDTNGVGNIWHNYSARTHGVTLANWCPCYDTMRGATYPYRAPLGQFAIWQRLFTARNKPDGTPSDIVAGGLVGDRVTVSKNEDVDFRASGRIKLKSGFHVKPGAFFHAYTEPEWGSTVFSDEFDSGISKWHVVHGWTAPMMSECSFDSNVSIVTDTDAHDDHALDIVLREDTSMWNVFGEQWSLIDSCHNDIASPPTPYQFLFSTAYLWSCPYPYQEQLDSPIVSAYPHAPYGKYEVRDKVPHIPHHTNNWGASSSMFNMNETENVGRTWEMTPALATYIHHGPYKGKFHRALPDSATDSVWVFVSNEPNWSLVNNPFNFYIDNFPYSAGYFDAPNNYDTVYANDLRLYNMGYPSSLTSRTDSITFYYSKSENNTADLLPWHVSQDPSSHHWTIFSAAYHDSSGTLLHFKKSYQPTSITLTTGFRQQKTLNCHWAKWLNTPTDTGALWLDDSLVSTDLHSNTEPYQYHIDEGYSGPAKPPMAVDIGIGGHTSSTDTMPRHIYYAGGDTGASPYDSTPYRYHTFSAEILPHEIRFLVDSNVIQRIPDRLMPRGSLHYDYASNLPREILNIMPAEFDIDPDPFDSTSVGYQERKYFEYYGDSCKGCWPVTIGGKTYTHAAHHLVDYVKIWDLPSDMIVPKFPQ